MPEYLAPGVYVEEVDSGARPIEGVSTSTTGMVGITERGPVNRPVFIDGWGRFTSVFGGLIDRRTVPQPAQWLFPHAVEGYFGNGGRRLYVVRVLPDAATHATLDLFGPTPGATATRLAAATGADPLLVLDSVTGIAAGERLRLATDPPAEQVVAAAGDVIALTTPAAGAHAAQAAVTGLDWDTTPRQVATQPSATSITLDDVTGLKAAGGDVLRIGNALVVTTSADPNDATTPVALAPPGLVPAAAAGAAVHRLVPAATAAALAHPLPAGGHLAILDDATPLSGSEAVEIGTERHLFGTPDLEGVALGLGGAHAAGSHVVEVTLNAVVNNPDRALVGSVSAGDTDIRLERTDDLAVDAILSFGNAEYGIVAVAEGTNPGDVSLRTPLRQDLAGGVTVSLVTETTAGVTRLARAGAPDDEAVVVTDGATIGSGDIVRIGAVGGTTTEYATLAATTADLLVLEAPPGGAHPAGATAAETRRYLSLRAIHRGAWGNALRAAVAAEDEPVINLVLPAGPTTAAGAPVLALPSTAGVEPGTILRFGTATPFEAKVETVNGLNVGFGPGGLPAAVPGGTPVRSVEFRLLVSYMRADPRTRRLVVDARLGETHRQLSLDPRHSRYVERVVGIPGAGPDDETDGESGLVRVDDPFSTANAVAATRTSPDLLTEIVDGETRPLALPFTGGDDQLAAVDQDTYIGDDAPDPYDRTGLQSLKNIEEISLVAIPGQTARRVQSALLRHCEFMRYRFAVADPPPGLTMERVVQHRNLLSSRYGALYYPWLRIDDPFPENPNLAAEVVIPPSGHVLGIYCRTDNQAPPQGGVHKAPANEVVTGINDLDVRLTKEQQDVLNPKGVNAMRDFRDRQAGLRVWGARCLTAPSDSDWKYVNVRRLFLYLEASIDAGTQWVVFQSNTPALWARVIQSVSAFLTVTWRDGALMGTTPAEAFYVKCDRTTMTQLDIDNGRLIMEIGVAPVKPAEFVVIRIGQWTAGAAGGEG